MLNKLDPFNLTPQEIGRIAAKFPRGMRAEYIVGAIAGKPYDLLGQFQADADEAMLELVLRENEEVLF